MLFYLGLVFVITIEIYFKVPSEGIETSFCLKVGLSNTFFYPYTVLVNQCALFFDAKYSDLQLYVTDYKNKHLLYPKP